MLCSQICEYLDGSLMERNLDIQGPKGVGFGGGAGTLGMDTGEHLGNKSGSEMT